MGRTVDDLATHGRLALATASDPTDRDPASRPSAGPLDLAGEATALTAEHDGPARLRSIHLRAGGPAQPPRAWRCERAAHRGRQPAEQRRAPRTDGFDASPWAGVSTAGGHGWGSETKARAWPTPITPGCSSATGAGATTPIETAANRRDDPRTSHAASGSPSPARSWRPTGDASPSCRPRAPDRRSSSGCR